MSKKRIYVTEDDIQLGIASSYDHCPVALATARALGAQTALVGCGTIEVCMTEGHNDFTGKMTNAVTRFTKRFDAGEAVRPFRFVFRYTRIGEQL